MSYVISDYELLSSDKTFKKRIKERDKVLKGKRTYMELNDK